MDMIDSNGCIPDSSTESITVSVSNLPTPGLTSSASDGLFCNGETINFTASGGVSYKWYIDGNEQFGSTFANFNKVLSGTSTVTVRVYNGAGCYVEQSLLFNEMTLDNNGLITLQNASDSNICDGQQPVGLILGDGTGGSLVGSSTFGTISYQWQRSIDSGSNYFDINGATNANYQPTGITTTTLFRRNVVISSNTTSCTFIGDDIVTINKRNSFDINLSTNDPSNTFCQDQNIIVSANTGAATYTFIINATTITSGSSTTLNLISGNARDLTASPPIIQNGDNVTVQITDNFNCTNQQTIPIIIDEVGLNPGVSTDAPGNIICLGENVEIEATGGVSYTFYINNTGNPALPAEVTANRFTTNRLNDGDVVISRVFNATGCYIDVNETFTVLSLSSTGSITLSVPADSDLCYNTSMAGAIDGGNLGVGGGAASTTIASATVAYQWQSSVNGGPWGDIGGATTQTLTPTGNFTVQTRYKRIAFVYYDTNGNGIFDEPISCARTDSNIITINPKADFDPSLNSGVEDNSYCAGESISISAPVGADTYRFFVNNVPLGPAGVSRTVTATAGDGGAPGEFDNGDIIKVEATVDGCVFTNEITVLVDFFGELSSASLSTNAAFDTICSGGSILLTAGPPVPGYTYTFDFGGAPIVQANEQLITTGITTTTVVTVTVENANGCSDTASLTVTVPQVFTGGDVTLPGDLTICPGDGNPQVVTNVEATVSAGATLSYRWQYWDPVAADWDDIAGATTSTLAADSLLGIVSNTTIRRVAYASQNGVDCAAGVPSTVGGAAVSIEIVVDNRDRPTITTNDADNTICDSDTITFTVGNNVPGDTIAWYVNDNPVGVATENWTPAAGVLNDGDSVTVGITTAAPGGCEYISDPVVVSISPTPAASLSTPSPSGTICSGASITLDALPAGQATYTFDIGNGQPLIIQGTEQLITTAIVTTTVVTVKVENAGGCSDVATRTITVPQVFTGGDVTLPGDLTICPGDGNPQVVTNVEATVSAGATLSYRWQYWDPVAADWDDIAGATTSTLAADSLLGIVSNTTIRRVAYASQNGVDCAAGVPSTVGGAAVSIEIVVDNRDRPTITTNDADNTICDSDTITFTVGNNVPGDTIAWYVDGNPVGVATENWTPAAGVLNDGDSVTVGITTAAPGGCEYISDPVVVSISPTPAASLSTPSPSGTICSGASITLDALPAGQATYTFDIGNGQPLIIQGTEQLITTAIVTTTVVTVTVENAGGCSDVATRT